MSPWTQSTGRLTTNSTVKPSKARSKAGGAAAPRLTCASRAVLLGGRLKQRRNPKICLHRSTVTTITAGLAREVCETCARVRLRYVESAVQIPPDTEPTGVERHDVTSFEAMITFVETSSRLQCRLCTQSAAFLVPDGPMCDEHAWQAAARIDWDESDPWIPIRIHNALGSDA